MTEQPTTDQSAAEPPPFTVAASSDERLSQLHAAYGPAKAELDAAAEKLDAIKAGIKAAMAAAAPEDATRIRLTGDDGPPLALTHSESWRIDSRKLKREDPETYVRYAKKSESWTLREVAGGEPE